MTPEEFFKQYPDAVEVLQVGDDLFFADYEKSASEFAQRVGIPLNRVSRPKATSEAKSADVATKSK